MKAKRCPICDTLYVSFQKECPNCRYREPFKINPIFALIVVLSIFIAYFNQDYGEKEIAFDNISKLDKKQKVNLTEKTIALNSMMELSGLSKAEILDIRKRAIKNSLVFSKIENYTPDSQVYNIQDSLPWISAYEIVKNGTGKNPKIGVGLSRHSLMIRNPEILLGYIIPDYGGAYNDKEPGEVDYFIPKKVIWDEKSNTIKIYFNYKGFREKYNYSTLTFYSDDTNARDLGFNWIYCYEKQGAVFSAVNNISKVPYKIKGYYHRGFACGLKEGCNNYSPLQNEMIYNIVSKNAILKFKLWKNKPITPLQKADINYEMYFE